MIIVTGTSYADATKNITDNPRKIPKTTFIGKNVRFPNGNNAQTKQSKPKPQNPNFPGHGSHNQAPNPNAPQPNLQYQNTRRPEQQEYHYYDYKPSQPDRQPNNYPKTFDRNTKLRPNDLWYRGNRQNNNR